jgi:hypothetical protein
VSPFPLLRGRGIVYLREAAPLFNSLIPHQKQGVSKRGFAPLFNTFPLSFKGEGDKGGEVGKTIL